MNNSPLFAEKHTYVPAEQDAEVIDFAEVLAALGRTAPKVQPHLVDADGRQTVIPPEIFDALVHITETLSSGRGVTVVPTDSQLTTQQAADYLGVSRPTLVKLLEQGGIPFSSVGRHRRVLLRDLVSYQEQSRLARREALDSMARESIGDGSYLASLKTDHRTR